MTNILYISSAESGFAQMAEYFTKEKKEQELNIFSGVLRDKMPSDKTLDCVMDEIGGKLPQAIKLKDLDYGFADVLILITSNPESEKLHFLPGYPTQVKWIIPKYNQDENKLISLRLIRDKISSLVDSLFESNYLDTLIGATARTHFILDSIPIGILAHDLDRYITFFNSAAEEITGYSKSEVIGKDCRLVFINGFCGSKCSFCDNHKLPDCNINYPVHLTKKNGEQRNVEMSLNSVKDSKGNAFGILASFQDRTDEFNIAKELKQTKSYAGIIGKHPKMLEIFALIKSVANTRAPVLISGASGTGKELVASAIHSESSDSNNNFVMVNCGALPEQLLESELFGHVKGAFTGAIRDKKGRFELADGGTILLDEIGDISQAMQVKLLRVLQEGTFERVGSEKTTKVKVRVISATNKNLVDEIKDGRFREDLFYRLNVFPIFIPSLKDRRSDIPLIAEHILKNLLHDNKNNIVISQEVLSIMFSYEWPGNIRELQNWLQFAIIKCGEGKVIRPEHLPIFTSTVFNEPVVKVRKARKRKLDNESVRIALSEANGNKAKAAKILGVGRATLYRYFDDFEK